MKTEVKVFQADGWTSVSEQSNYGEGCDPKTTTHDSGNDRIEHTQLEGLMHLLLRWTGAPAENVVLNSCDEIGRVDIRVMQGDDAVAAQPYILDLWKAKKIWLWDTIYTFQVRRVTRIEESTLVDLVSENAMARFTKDPVDATDKTK